jgi:hypothetical protein
VSVQFKEVLESRRDESIDRFLSSPAGAVSLSDLECELWLVAHRISFSAL